MPTDQKFWLLVQFVAVGVLLVVICIPLILRKVPPNRWYGFRTPGTLKDPELWYPANAMAGKLLVASGITIVIGAVGFYYIRSWGFAHYAFAVLGVTLLSLGIALVESTRYLQQLKKEGIAKETSAEQESPAEEISRTENE